MRDHPDLLAKDAPFGTIHELATPAERAILDGLSKQLDLTGDGRIAAAQRESAPISPRPLARTRANRPADVPRACAIRSPMISSCAGPSWPMS